MIRRASSSSNSDQMHDPTRSVFRDSAIFGLGGVAGKAAAFLVIPFLTRLLTTEDFGRLDVLNALISTGILVLFLGTDVAALRLFYDVREESRRRHLLATWYALMFAVAVPVGLSILAAAVPIASSLLGSRDHAGAVSAAGLALIAGVAQLTTLGILRALGRPRDYMLLEGGALVANAILTVVVLAAWKPDVQTAIMALAVCWSVAALVGGTLIWPTIAVRPTRELARALLALGLPLAPAVIASAFADFFNRAYLLDSAGATEAAFYSLALRYASVALLVSTAIQLAWQPRAFHIADDGEGSRTLAAEARIIAVVLVTTCLVLQLVSPEAIQFLGAGQYHGSLQAVGLLLIGALFLGLFAIIATQSVLAKKTHHVGICVAIGVAVTVATNIVLASQLGATGTAFGVVLGNLCSLACVLVLGFSGQRLPIRWAPSTLIVVLGVTVMSTTLLVDGPTEQLRIVLGVAFLIGLLLEGTLLMLVRSSLDRVGAARGRMRG